MSSFHDNLMRERSLTRSISSSTYKLARGHCTSWSPSAFLVFIRNRVQNVCHLSRITSSATVRRVRANKRSDSGQGPGQQRNATRRLAVWISTDSRGWQLGQQNSTTRTIARLHVGQRPYNEPNVPCSVLTSLESIWYHFITFVLPLKSISEVRPLLSWKRA